MECFRVVGIVDHYFLLVLVSYQALAAKKGMASVRNTAVHNPTNGSRILGKNRTSKTHSHANFHKLSGSNVCVTAVKGSVGAGGAEMVGATGLLINGKEHDTKRNSGSNRILR